MQRGQPITEEARLDAAKIDALMPFRDKRIVEDKKLKVDSPNSMFIY